MTANGTGAPIDMSPFLISIMIMMVVMVVMMMAMVMMIVEAARRLTALARF